MTGREGRMAAEVGSGSVLLPWMLEDPLRSPGLVGRILGRGLKPGDPVDEEDLHADAGPDFIRLYDYFERPGGMDRIVDLDRRAYDELGDVFADEPWTADNFRYELPGKAEYSYVAEQDGAFVGFCIASEKVRGEIHGHRIVIEPRWRTGRIALQLWCAHWRGAAVLPHVRRITGEVGTDNRTMRRFLELLHFRPLDAAETRAYLEARGRDERLEGVEIIAGNGARSVAYELPVRETG